MLGSKSKLVVSPFLFVQYSMCPAWLWHNLYTDSNLKGELPELALKLMEQGVLHEKDYIKDLDFKEVDEKDPSKAFKITRQLMEQGVDRIYQGAIETEIDGNIWRGRPDLLEKMPGKSKLGNWFYVPVDIKSSKKIKLDHEYQLAFYARVLKDIQNKLPDQAVIINKEKKRLDLQITEELLSKMYDRVNQILSVLAGRKPDLHCRSACKQTPWGHICLSDCKKVNDAALIYNIRDTTLYKLRDAGIETVNEVANLDCTTPQFGIATATWKRIVLQAQSLKDDKLIWLSKLQIPSADYKIYFDIEGDPLLEVEYMFGFWLGNEQKFKYFLAQKPEDEKQMWKAFLVWLKELPNDYIVYHYANYEKAVIKKLEERYGGSKELEIFKDRLVDLFKIVKNSVIFPLYFYSVKDLAKSRFINYKWRHQKAGGAQSIFWYEKWLETQDKQVLQDIIDYNEDDVIATQHLHNWLIEAGNQ